MRFEKYEIEIGNTGHITNSYILYNNNDIAIIDPADKFEFFKEKIEKEHLNLKYVFLTHAHADHILALYKILEKYDVKVIVSQNEKDMLEKKIDNCASVFGLEQKTFDLEKFIFVDDREYIDFNGIKIKCISTPGHTKGSCCYLIEKNNILFTGDTIFESSFGRTDLASGSSKDIINSIVKLFKNYNECVIYPGHGSSGFKLKNIYGRINRCTNVFFNINLDNLV